jgi:hypothetical protein
VVVRCNKREKGKREKKKGNGKLKRERDLWGQFE